MINLFPLRATVIFCLLLFACDNEPYEGEIIGDDAPCLLSIEATNEAATNFSNATPESYSTLCQSYLLAINNQIEFCGDNNGNLQTLIESLGTCEFTQAPCDAAVTATNTARIVYESAVGEAFSEACIAYREAIAYQIEICDDPDGSLQLLFDDLGDCEPEEVIDVVGTWKLILWNTDALRDLNNDGITTNNYLDDIDCYDNETISFSLDGTGTMFLRSTAEFTFTPTEDGEDFFTTCAAISIDKTFTWTETVNSVMIAFTDGTFLNLFKNGNLYTAIDDAFTAYSTVDDSVITERITFVYEKL